MRLLACSLVQELGELAHLDVTNDSRVTPAAPLEAQPVRKAWKPKVTLRGHYDGVRAVAFHPATPQIFSAAEDGTVKVWEADLAAKKMPVDVEPTATFRGHTCVREGGSQPGPCGG